MVLTRVDGWISGKLLSMDKQQNFVVLWSHSQQCTHIETVPEMLAHNRSAFGLGKGGDYIPIAFTQTEREADIVATCLQNIRDCGWRAHG